MSKVTKTIHVKIQTFDPVQGQLIPVPNAHLLIEDNGLLWDPNLSSGSDSTDAAGVAQVAVTYEESDLAKLNPFVTVTLTEPNRTVPAGAPAPRQFQLPAEWVTRHYVKRRIPNLLAHEDAANPLTIFVGLSSRLRVAYPDFHSSRLRNPLALPEDTLRVLLADYDEFLWIDWLDPDDTMTGVGGNPKSAVIVNAGEQDQYPYFDVPPTAPWVVDEAPTTPRAAIDPPGAPVGSLGGGSFTNAGPLAVDPHGFVFLIDGNLIQRFYPDGTLCETIKEWRVGGVTHTFSNPRGLALDQYRNLYVADTDNHRLVILQLGWRDGEGGRYTPAGTAPTMVGTFGSGVRQFDHPSGLAVVPNRVVDGEELLAVTDPGNHRVAVYRISPGVGSAAHLSAPLHIQLHHLADFGAPVTGSGASAANPVAATVWEPVSVAADRQRRIYVCDKSWHRISRWAPDNLNTPTGYLPNGDWEKAGGGSGNGPREFTAPTGVTVDSKNNYLYVADAANLRVQRLDAESGNHLLTWEHTYEPDLPNPFVPTTVAADGRGEIYVADTANQRVLRGTPFAPEGTPLADGATPRLVGTPWTPASDLAHLVTPAYVAFAPDGKLWVSDTGNNRVLSYERNPAGEFVLAAPRITADLLNPAGVVVTPEGAIIVVDAGHHRVRSYDSALVHQADFGTGTAGAGAGEFNNPRGIAHTLRGGLPTLYVADRNNQRVKVLKSDGSTSDLTAGGGVNLKEPEDVAVDSQGNLFVADTGNARLVQFDASDTFVRAITINSQGLSFGEPCGVFVDDEDKLIVTDRAKNLVVRVDPGVTTGGAAAVLAFWDLQGLLRLRASTNVQYYPDLARQVVFAKPQRAVVNEQGLLAVADSDQQRVRLLRIYTHLAVNIFDLGERFPDISLRANSEADWRTTYGLKLKVGGDDTEDFSATPQEKFSEDTFHTYQLLGKENIHAATNAIKTIRQWQRWLAHATRTDVEEHRWGVTTDRKRLRLKVKLRSNGGSAQPWDDDLLYLGSNNNGRGIDAWDDSVIVHEMTHWITEKAYRPRIPFKRKGDDHTRFQLVHENLAFNEGIANFFRFCFEAHFGSADRLRGFSLVGGSALTTLDDKSGNTPYLYGGSSANPTPTWADPGLALRNEGYVANALWQIFHLLIGSDIFLADSPAYWYGHNLALDTVASQRFVNVIWQALRLFPNDPTKQEFETGCTQYFKQLLKQARNTAPELAPLVQSIYELNNLLMPTIRVTEGASDSTPGTAIPGPLTVAEGATRHLIVQVTDATGQPLAGYQVAIAITTGNSAHYTLAAVAAPVRQHGLLPATPAPNTLYRATNAQGIVNFSVTPGGGTAGNTERVQISYQPDFDQDDSFAPPTKGDNREWTLRRLYLYELRAVNKVWGKVNENWGAQVTAALEVSIQAP